MQFKKDQTKEKLRGGYYTPLELAIFISRWVASAENVKTILEPSCGDGVFFEAVATAANHHIHIDGFEIEGAEAYKAKNRSKGLHNIDVEVQTKDFLRWYLNDKPKNYFVDGIVGNPPFIRYQYLPKDAQLFSEQIFRQNNLYFTRHTNAWVPFIVASLNLLKPGGRLGMILPAEILHVMHAQSIRQYLGIICKKIVIFDPEELWFKNTLQGAIILLAEKKNDIKEKAMGVGIVRTVGNKFMISSPADYIKNTNYMNGKTIVGKWTRALLNKDELDLFDSLAENEKVFHFDELADVDVGMVTGANDFFLVPNETVSKYKLNKWAYPMFGRSAHCPGVIYNKKQHIANANKGLPTNFIWFDVDSDKELNPEAKEYIISGKQQDLHKRYKCRIRSP